MKALNDRELKLLLTPRYPYSACAFREYNVAGGNTDERLTALTLQPVHLYSKHRPVAY